MLGLRNPNHYNPEEPGKALEFGQAKVEVKVEIPKEEVKIVVEQPKVISQPKVDNTLKQSAQSKSIVEEIKKKLIKKK